MSNCFDNLFLRKSEIIFDLHALCLTSNKHDDDDNDDDTGGVIRTSGVSAT